MENLIRATAIVSTYNGERFIRGCLEDLVSQTLFTREELEIVVADSCSPQNEAAIVAEFSASHPDRIRYARAHKRETLYAAWNCGIALAQGTYLTSANVDDRHDPRCLEILADALDAHPNTAVAYVDSDVTTDANIPFADAKRTRRLAWPDFSRNSLFETCYLGPHPMWRSSLHDRYDTFDDTMQAAGDYEFWLRLAAAGEHFLHLPQPLSLYLENPSSLSLANEDLTWQESETARDRHWKKEWGSHPKFRQALLHFTRLKKRIEQLPLNSRIALYGAGKHTQKMLPLFRDSIEPHAKIIAILDDVPGTKTEIQCIPVLPINQWPTLNLAAIISSSDTQELKMVAKLQTITQSQVPLITLYQ